MAPSVKMQETRLAKWYFGGLASAGAACCTHPLDLLKGVIYVDSGDFYYGDERSTLSKVQCQRPQYEWYLRETGETSYSRERKVFNSKHFEPMREGVKNERVHLQTQQEGKLSIIGMTMNIIRKQGVLALYNGLSASLLRQLTYSTTRFGIYEVTKQRLSTPGENVPFHTKVLMAAAGGAAGGLVGTPADMVNVRMQNDIKLPVDQRRNYKHAIDGLWKVFCTEGVSRLFSGATMATSRAILMTIGQLSFYDQVKQTMLKTPHFSDNLVTHFLASLTAGAIATTLTQPLDVLKTRTMNAKPGEYRSLGHCILVTAQLGPLGFFKGYIPAFVRLAPQTILTFVFFEQLRKNFGTVVRP